MLPKVSVFLPTYNQRHFLDETIASILVQDYPNLEIVAGDDGSTDGTQELLKKYAERYPGLFKLVLSPVNTGITANCNRILRECTGDYVALFSGDDLWLPGKLYKQVMALEYDSSAALCYGKVEAFDSETKKKLWVAPDDSFKVEAQGSIIYHAAHIGSCGCTVLFRKSAAPSYGYESTLRNVSDWLFFIELLRNGKAVYIKEVLSKYRRHGENSSSNSHYLFSEHLVTLAFLEKKYEELVEPVNNYREYYLLLNHGYVSSSLNSKKSILKYIYFLIMSSFNFISSLKNNIFTR